ncbi:MAG: NAD(P)H-hydrate dehydratase, partial [Candidatus Nanopelagicales bacterium]|nr:NAD(P)H-hydrate dehydratase [Candidatus Nanopelagicales bacterium]
GGDALFAGASLARRGARVVVIPVSSGGSVDCHEGGLASLVRNGGRLLDPSGGGGGPLADEAITEIINADLVIDGILGIGGRGGLRDLAADLAIVAAASDAIVIATDLPSGVEADTGAIPDPHGVISADVTVTFGCLKPGLLLMPGAEQAGDVRVIDIGITPWLPAAGVLTQVDNLDAACWTRRPGPLDDKYTRGVVGVVAGSTQYPGAGVLCTGSARLGGVGMVRYAGTAVEAVIARWPDVVPHPGGPVGVGKVQAWVFGPGAGTDERARAQLEAVLETPVPVLVDADGLTMIAHDDRLRRALGARWARGRVTVLTPHEGEFERLGFRVGSDRRGAVAAAARELGAVVLLKGSITLVAEPGGRVWANTVSSSALATAGSGDVLSGLAGSMLAANAGRGLDIEAAAQVTAVAAMLHGRAGQLAAASGGPVTAPDVLDHVQAAVAEVGS